MKKEVPYNCHERALGAINDEDDGVGRIRGSSNGLDDRDEEDEDKEARNRPQTHVVILGERTRLSILYFVSIFIMYRVTHQDG